MLKNVKYLSICIVLAKMLFTQNKKERFNLSLFLVMYCFRLSVSTVAVVLAVVVS